MASVTNVYARAFADAVFDAHLDPQKTLKEAQALSALVAESRELREVWETPSITPEQKRAVLDALVSRQGISPIVRNFVAVLIDKRRTNFLAAIVRQFELELDRRMGFEEVEITSARELSDPEKQNLLGRIEKLTGKKARARYRRDAALLGGAVIRVGSTIYDGSVSGQLERIREALSS
ncbi:MAG TPA: ATP synthase F1 subunit delta [Terriglobales bacterium]|nr:ATP synthase F1 subunit delta [Terriglobales bacterium]